MTQPKQENEKDFKNVIAGIVSKKNTQNMLDDDDVSADEQVNANNPGAVLADSLKKEQEAGDDDAWDFIPDEYIDSDEDYLQPKRNRPRNSGRKNRTSRFKGVHWCNKANIFKAQLTFNGKQYYIGSFKNEEDAARAINKRCRAIGKVVLNPQLKPDEEEIKIMENRKLELIRKRKAKYENAYPKRR
eukprot:UN23605